MARSVAVPTAESAHDRNWRLLAGLTAVLIVLFAVYPLLNQGPARWDLRTPLDQRIPLVTPFVVPYLSALALGPATLLALMWKAPRLAASVLVAAILLMVVAYAFYIAAQTHVPRPQVTGDDLFSRTLRVVYESDNAYNCFPSLHTGYSVIMAMYWLRFRPRGGRFVAGWCVLIIASTLFIHQHYIADMLGGLVVASAACWAAAELMEHDR